MWPALAAKVTTNSKTYTKPAGTSTASSQTKQRRPTMSDQHTLPTGHVRHVATERFADRITGPEFDAWLASVKAEAWDAAIAEAAEQGTIQIPENPYREQETP